MHLRSELREMQSQTFACFVSGKKLDKFHLNKELNGSREKKAYHLMLEIGERQTDTESDKTDGWMNGWTICHQFLQYFILKQQ